MHLSFMLSNNIKGFNGVVIHNKYENYISFILHSYFRTNDIVTKFKQVSHGINLSIEVNIQIVI